MAFSASCRSGRAAWALSMASRFSGVGGFLAWASPETALTTTQPCSSPCSLPSGKRVVRTTTAGVRGAIRMELHGLQAGLGGQFEAALGLGQAGQVQIARVDEADLDVAGQDGVIRPTGGHLLVLAGRADGVGLVHDHGQDLAGGLIRRLPRQLDRVAQEHGLRPAHGHQRGQPITA